jgi:hypothetical protein
VRLKEPLPAVLSPTGFLTKDAVKVLLLSVAVPVKSMQPLRHKSKDKFNFVPDMVPEAAPVPVAGNAWHASS